MKADLSRDTFEPRHRFSRVLLQQGRVLLDADWNEQHDILLDYIRALTADVIGPYGGPDGNAGFGVSIDASSLSPADQARLNINNNELVLGDFLIGAGRYYVGGVLVENAEVLTFLSQPDLPATKAINGGQSDTFLVYLDVWERHVTGVEHRRLREVALGGPDTATRAQVLAQVKVLQTDLDLTDPTSITVDKVRAGLHILSIEEQRILRNIALITLTAAVKKIKGKDKVTVEGNITELRKLSLPADPVRLRARAYLPNAPIDPCSIQPDSRYRGAENQLYRVEVHRSGPVPPGGGAPGATFKWSRENGSVVFPIRSLAGAVATVTSLGRDARFGLQVGDWVEVVDDDSVLQNFANPLLRVKTIKDLDVTLGSNPVAGQNSKRHRLLRRWDQTGDANLSDGAVPIVEGAGDNGWLTLEDGVQVQFQSPPTGAAANFYTTGDYWLIPARVATGDVEWPGPSDDPAPLPPRGIRHRYAPLATIKISNNQVTLPTDSDLRVIFDAL